MRLKIDSLTATRGLAAALVVIYHFADFQHAPFILRRLLDRAYLSAGYFFVLSGFIMYLSYVNNYKGFGDFIKKRIARIVPLYWFALLLTVLLTFYSIYKGQVPDFNVGKAFTTHFFFLEGFSGTYVHTLNSPGWTLSVEMCFYLLFPLFLKFQKNRPKAFLIFTIACYIGTRLFDAFFKHQFITYYNLTEWDINTVLQFNQFFVGMVAAQYCHKLPRTGYMPLFFALLIFLTIMFVNNLANNGSTAILFALLIASLAQKEPTFLTSRVLVYLGEISYSMYILQMPVRFYFLQINNHVFHLQGNACFLVYFSVLIGFASLCYHTIEQPFVKKISSLKLRVFPINVKQFQLR